MCRSRVRWALDGTDTDDGRETIANVPHPPEKAADQRNRRHETGMEARAELTCIVIRGED